MSSDAPHEEIIKYIIQETTLIGRFQSKNLNNVAAQPNPLAITLNILI